MKAERCLSILHLAMAATLSAIALYALLPYASQLWSIGMLKSSLAMAIAIVFIPAIYAVLGIALWTRGKGVFWHVLTVHVAIGVLTLLQLSRATDISFALLGVPALHGLGIALLLIPLIRISGAFLSIAYVLPRLRLLRQRGIPLQLGLIATLLVAVPITTGVFASGTPSIVSGGASTELSLGRGA